MIVDNARKAIRLLAQRGIEARFSGGGHWKLYYRGQFIAVMSKNLNDARGWKNLRSVIRRATGLEL